MTSALSLESAYALRGPRMTDVPFIRNSWTQSYAKYARVGDQPRAITGEGPARVHVHVYLPEQHAMIARIMERPTTTTIVACNPQDADQIFGYAVIEASPPAQAVVHYLYVKDAFRKRGLAKALLAAVRAVAGEGPFWASHWSPLIPGKRSAVYPFEFNSYKVNGL